MKTAVILQTRLDSSRLPRKALLDLCGKKVLERVMEALTLVHSDMKILAVDFDSAHELEKIADEYHFNLYSGSKNDVLSRYAGAIYTYSIDTVIRATGDNPLVSYELANMLVELVKQNPCDYAGFINMPSGMGVEVVRATSLLRAHEESDDAYDREHVCPYLYRNPQKFTIFRPSVPDEYTLPHANVSIDTQEDYTRLVAIYKQVYNGKVPKTLDVMNVLKTIPQLRG